MPTFGPLSKPAAGAPLSSWQPAIQVVPASASYLAKSIDPQTGEMTSLTTGMDPTDASLVTQARTQRGSGAAVLEDGHALATIEQNDDDASGRIRFELARLAKPFVDRREIDQLDIEVEAGPDAGDLGAALIRYRNVRTSQQQEVPVTTGI